MAYISFSVFLTLWNQRQGMETPHVHLKIAAWLEAHYKKDARLLLMAFRSCGKSTIGGLFACWLLFQNPDLRILVMAAESALAGKMVRQVKRILERHPLSKHLKPAQADQWASDRFTVNRNAELRDPSVLARGITSNITGARADLILCDDVEVPNTSDTAEKRENLRDRLQELTYVLAPDGVMLYIGTPHTYHSIYADLPRLELGEEHAFLEGYDRLLIPIENEAGESAWPQRYSAEDIARIKTQTGPNKFASQMLLQPVNIAEGRLDADALQFYDAAHNYVPELRRMEIGNTPMISASAYWDPALGNSKDSSVLAIVFSDADGGRYLHHLEYLKINAASADDEATQQCRTIAQLAKRYMLPFVTIETNGIGRMLPNILRREMKTVNAACTVREKHNARPKDLRILEGFDALLAARRLHIHRSVLKTPFIAEMKEWRPELSNPKDDGLDAVAGALAAQPLRLQNTPPSQRQSWHHASGANNTAKIDFDV